MKLKNVAILVLGLFVGQNSFAQGEKEFRFGIKATSNIGWFEPGSKNVDRAGLRMNFGYGAMADYFFTPRYALSAEVLLNTYGGNVELKDTQRFKNDPAQTPVTGVEYHYTMQFLEIPVSLKFRTREIGYITYWANFGTAPGFLISSKASIIDAPAAIDALDPTGYRTNDDEGDEFEASPFDDQLFPIRIPLIFGGGIDYRLAGSASLHAGLRYSQSFTDALFKDKSVNAKNHAVSITVGVFF